jgi:Domain of Unknown Function (DUF349)
MSEHENQENPTPEQESAPEMALFSSPEELAERVEDGTFPEPDNHHPAGTEEIGPEEPVAALPEDDHGTGEPADAAPPDEAPGAPAAPADAGQIAARIEALERQMGEASDKTRYLRRLQSLREQVAHLAAEEADGLAPRLDALDALCQQQLEENLRQKEALVTRCEELSTSEEWKPAAEEIKALQAQWKTIGSVPQEKSQELWQRFRKAGNTFFERRQQHVRDLGQQQEENLRQKEALCVRAEELSQSTQWKAAADAFKALQAEWKTIGPVPREHSEAIWQRFRQSADTFFGRRSEHYSKLRKDQTENLRQKEALCVRAEELSQSTQWKATSEAIKALQAEWKAIGPVPQNKADAIWKRFRGAIDVFFDRQKAWFDQRNQEKAEWQGEWREQLRDTLERKRGQVERLRESIGRDEENIQRWQGTLADLRPGPHSTDIRASLEGKISDVETKLASKRERLQEIETSIGEIEAKLG